MSEARLEDAIQFLVVSSLEARDELDAAQILLNSDPILQTEQYDNWNGGLYYVTLRLVLDYRTYSEIAPADLTQHSQTIRAAAEPLLRLTENDTFLGVTLEPGGTPPPNWREEARARLQTRTARSRVPDSKQMPYELAPKPIATGGQAQVFQAIHRTTRQCVALKRRTPASEREEGRFRREIDLLQRLDHPNIMPILDMASDGSWFTMPIAKGALSAFKDEDWPPAKVTTLITDIAKGLAAAHRLHICHRDVAPGNILLLDNPPLGQRWVVSDFGAARRPLGETTFARTMVGHVIGTPSFAAPEAWIDGHKVDHRCDIYSLGRVVAWLVSKTAPVPNVPLLPEGEWWDFIRKTTARDPNERPVDMDAVIALAASPGAAPHRTLAEWLHDVDSANTEEVHQLLATALQATAASSFFNDQLGQAKGLELTRALVHSSDLSTMVMARLAETTRQDWGRRPFSNLSLPLNWGLRLLMTAHSHKRFELLETLAELYFDLAAGHDQWAIRDAIHAWLRSIRDQEAATRIARVLRRSPTSRAWLQKRWQGAAAVVEINHVLSP